MKAKKLLSILLALAVICTTAVMPVMANGETAEAEPNYIWNFEFDTIPGNGFYTLPTASTVDGKTVAVFDSAANTNNNRIAFKFIADSAEYTAMKAALNNGPVKFETSFYTEGTNSVIREFLGGLFRVRNGSLQACDGKATIVKSFADGWHTVSSVFEFTDEGVEIYEVIVDGVPVKLHIGDIDDYTSPERVLDGSYNYVIMQNPDNDNKTAKMYVDYLRVSAAVVSETVDNTDYLVKEMLYDLEFNELTSVNDFKTRNAAPWIDTENGYAVFSDEVSTSRNDFYFISSEEKSEEFKQKVTSDEIAVETKFRFSGKVQKVLFNNVMQVTADNSLYIGGRDTGIDLNENEWYKISMILDYTSTDETDKRAILKSFKINGVTQNNASVLLYSSMTDVRGASYLLSRDVGTNDFFFTHCTPLADTSMEIDYMRVYSVVPEIQGKTTEYAVKDWVCDFEFNERNSIPYWYYGRIPVVDTYDGEGVLKMEATSANASAFRLTYNDTDNSVYKKRFTEALASGDTVLEYRFYLPEGNASFKDFFQPLMSGYAHVEIGKWGENKVNLEPGWHTVSAIFNYSATDENGDNILKEVKKFVVDGIEYEINQYNAEGADQFANFDTLAEAVGGNGGRNPLMVQQQYNATSTNNTLYLDYFRVYTAADSPEAITTDLNGTKAESFAAANYLNFAKKDISVGNLIIAAYYNSENLMIGTNSFEITSADLAENVVTKALVKPEGAEDVKVFVFTNADTLSPASISPLTID